MTERESMIKQGTARMAGRAAREHPGPPPRGWAAVVMRVAGSGLLIATAVIHLDLYLTGYRTIPTIGWLFLLQVIAAFGLGLTVLAIPSPAGPPRAASGRGRSGLRPHHPGRVHSVGLDRAVRLQGSTRDRRHRCRRGGGGRLRGPGRAGAGSGRGGRPSGRRGGSPATVAARISPTVTRSAGMIAAILAVAALVLLGLAVAGAHSAAPAATGASLKTTTIRGTTVLTNAKGLTLYSFAPDTPTSSKCYGSCTVYWPPWPAPPRPGGACRARSPRSPGLGARASSPTTGTRCTPTSATALLGRPGATISTSTAGCGTSACLRVSNSSN